MLPGIKQFDLTGRSAIVTGGSKGLGRAMAAGLASAGASVLLISRHADEAVSAAWDIKSEHGQSALGLGADVTDPLQVEEMTTRAMVEFGKIDILINSAGITVRGPIDELTYEQFQEVNQVNVDGSWLCSRAAIRHMKAARSGKIIHVASTLGVVGFPNQTPYAASKGAIVQLTRSMSLELAPFGITCNAICPGSFMTNMNSRDTVTNESDNFRIGGITLRRRGRLEEIQGAAIYLASDASSFVTGSLLMIDGGWTAQ